MSRRSLTCILFSCTLILMPLRGLFAVEIVPTVSPEDAALTLYIEDATEYIDSQTYYTWVDYEPFLIEDRSYIHELETSSFCPVHRRPCFLRRTQREIPHIRRVVTARVDRDSLVDYVEDASTRNVSEPVDAELAVTDGVITVKTAHKNGYSLPVARNVDLITRALIAHEKEISLVSAPTPAAIRADNYQDELGLRELIGEGRSDFAGSTASRIHNIRTAASKFDDLIIPPGEEFSFVANLGPVDGTAGYKKELVIKNNQTIPEYGGGVCQVSTTIFRGAVLTGMEITERRNHSYPVKYYKPYGFDATIYLPAPDIKFKNNTAHHIMLDTQMEGTELVFRYYGTKDGRTVAMDGPHITEKNPDGSMKTNFTQTVTKSDGTPLIEQTFYSNYKSPKAYPRADIGVGGGGGVFTSKPKDWSKKQWKSYKKANGL